MEENNVAAVEQPTTTKPTFGERCKEFFRLRMIGLKRKPQNIAFLMLLVTTVFNLLVLGSYSKGLMNSGASANVDWVGLFLFVNTLLSILIVLTFMNSFPKMKKYNSKTTLTVNFTKASKLNINLIMVAVTLIFAIVMIICEVEYRSMMGDYYISYTETIISEEQQANADLIAKTNGYSLVHIVLLAIDMVLFLLTPLFGKLFAKVNTDKHLESAVENMEEIDLASED